jgi:hypothetical protein
MKLSRDELEFAISQYIDGTLSVLERDALEERLATDPEARELLAEYRKLNTVVKASAMPMPAIAWDRLAEQIGQATAAEEAPVRHYRIGAMSWTGRLAIAASLLLVISLGVFFVKRDSGGIAPQSEGFVQITVSGSGQSGQPQLGVVPIAPAPTDATGLAAQIQIGPSPTYAAQDWRFGEDVVARPTVVLIDRAASSGQDSDSILN